MPTPLIQIRQLEAHEPKAIDAEIQEARRLIDVVIGRKLALSSSVLTSVLMSIVRRVFTTAVPGFAVTLAGDGNAMLLVNPGFACDLGADGATMVAVHEAYHLVMSHLLVDPDLRANPLFELATEASINWRMLNMFNTTNMLTVPDPRDDNPDRTKAKRVESGVNPYRVFTDYKKALKEAGFDALKRIEDFYRTDLGCLAELSCMPRPPKQQNNFCVHMSGSSAGSGEGEGEPSPVQMDQDEIARLVSRALEVALHEATSNGNKVAKDELVKLMVSTGDNERASRVWGDLGAGILRGETTATRKTDLWERWTADAMATRLAEGNRLRYAKKVPWDPRVTAHGREPLKQGIVAVDASGSMHKEVLDKVAALIGETDNLEVTWVSFDGAVWPFVPGEEFQGGGGTNCQLVDEWIEDNYDDFPDFVLVITDGYFNPFTPTDPDAWIWLITSGGATWPEKWNPPMACRELEFDV